MALDSTLRPNAFEAEAASVSSSSAPVASGSMKFGVSARSQMQGSAKSLTSEGRVRSAPSLSAPEFFPNSTQGSTWYAGSCSQASASKKSCWKPLGGTWRDFETVDGFNRLRSNADEGKSFVRGQVPHYGREAIMRMKGVLAHELQWRYYEVRRDPKHPARKEVGDYLPNTDVVESMRDGGINKFMFWRDLRPPFEVVEVQRADNGRSDWLDIAGRGAGHPDGELYLVTYECGLEYVGERKWGDKSDSGTFNNKVHGVAQVRISNDFPDKRPLTLVSWGKPVLNFIPKPSEVGEAKFIDPGLWNPLSDLLGVRADSPKMETVRRLTREANRKAALRASGQAAGVQKMLLGPHPSLTQMAKAERAMAAGGTSAPAKMKQRTVFTAAGGFVKYVG